MDNYFFIHLEKCFKNLNLFLILHKKTLLIQTFVIIIYNASKMINAKKLNYYF